MSSVLNRKRKIVEEISDIERFVGYGVNYDSKRRICDDIKTKLTEENYQYYMDAVLDTNEETRTILTPCVNDFFECSILSRTNSDIKTSLCKMNRKVRDHFFDNIITKAIIQIQSSRSSNSPNTLATNQTITINNPQPSPVINSHPSRVVNPQSSPVVNPQPSRVVNPQPSHVVNPQTSPVVNPQTSPVVNPRPLHNEQNLFGTSAFTFGSTATTNQSNSTNNPQASPVLNPPNPARENSNSSTRIDSHHSRRTTTPAATN